MTIHESLKSLCGSYHLLYSDHPEPFRRTYLEMIKLGASPLYDLHFAEQTLIEVDEIELLIASTKQCKHLYQPPDDAILLLDLAKAGVTEAVEALLPVFDFSLDRLSALFINAVKNRSPFNAIMPIVNYDMDCISDISLTIMAKQFMVDELTHFFTLGIDPNRISEDGLRHLLTYTMSSIPLAFFLRKGMIPPPNSLPFHLFLKAKGLPENYSPMDYLNSAQFEPRYHAFVLSFIA